jgi:alpha-glucosidase
MINHLLLALITGAGLIVAIPTPQNPHFSTLQARDADPNACPGYTASNVLKTDSSLTADLTLAGAACNVYSDDIKDLKLVVEYQTSEYFKNITLSM